MLKDVVLAPRGRSSSAGEQVSGDRAGRFGGIGSEVVGECTLDPQGCEPVLERPGGQASSADVVGGMPRSPIHDSAVEGLARAGPARPYGRVVGVVQFRAVHRRNDRAATSWAGRRD